MKTFAIAKSSNAYCKISNKRCNPSSVTIKDNGVAPSKGPVDKGPAFKLSYPGTIVESSSIKPELYIIWAGRRIFLSP